MLLLIRKAYNIIILYLRCHLLIPIRIPIHFIRFYCHRGQCVLILEGVQAWRLLVIFWIWRFFVDFSLKYHRNVNIKKCDKSGCTPSKGQLISKCLFGIFKSPKKNEWKNSTLLHTMVPQVELFSFVFWENCRHKKDISKLTDL